MNKLIFALLLGSTLTAQAAPLTVQGYSCANQDILEADIKSLEDLHLNFKTNSFVKGQILKEYTFARREQEMLKVICRNTDEGTMVIVEDSRLEY